MFVRKFTPSMPQLLAFEAAARHGNFTAAAQELHLTQSAISRHVQELEASLSACLFERTGRRVRLTPDGRRYAQAIGAALERIRSASMDVYDASARAGALQLAVLPIMGSKWLMPRMSRFHDRHPGVLVNVHSRIGRVEQAMAGMDAYLTLGDGSWPRLIAHHLLEVKSVVIASPALLLRQPLRRLADLARHRLLQIDGMSSGWKECLMASGLDPRRHTLGARYDYAAHLIQAVLGGMGLGLVPELFVADEVHNGSLQLPQVKGFVADTKHYYLLYPAEKENHAALALFRDWLLEETAPRR